tara:strand:- start:2235 stop:2702 length:468 start_codon:yes stop_codon:yes gene_type:complete
MAKAAGMNQHSEIPSRMKTGRPARMRVLWLALGFLCVTIGAVGLILPLVPGVPFLIIALWAFSKSSKRFHHWLYTHEIFGPPLRAWNSYRVISPKAKLLAATGMTVALVTLIATGATMTTVIIVAIVLAGCAVYVLSRPNRPPRPATGQTSGNGA